MDSHQGKHYLYFLFGIIDVFLIVNFLMAAPGEQSQAWITLLLTAAFGIYSAVAAKQSSDAQADLVEQENEITAEQNRINAQLAREDAEEQAKAEQAEVSNLRDQQRRRRAQIEAGYAKSGLVLDGSVIDMLGMQRETDEYNIQSIYKEGGDRRTRNLWQSVNNQQVMNPRAKLYRQQGNTALIAGIGNTAASSYGLYSNNQKSGNKSTWW